MKRIRIAATLLSVFACADESGGLGRVEPEGVISPAELDLGEAPIGVRLTRQLTVENRGVGALSIRSARFDGETVFGLDGSLPIDLAPSGTHTFTVHGSPDALRRFRAELELDTNDGILSAIVMLTGVPRPDCEDNNPCTREFFDTALNECVTEFADGESCSPADKCIINAVCSAGVCLGESKACGDSSVCTRDVCRQTDGQCIFIEDPDICDDDNPCTTDTCGPAGCSSLALPNGTACNDQDDCTINDACFAGTCRGAPLPNGQACDDGNSCTVGDQCVEGRCSGSNILVNAEEGEVVFEYALTDWEERAFLHRREVSLSPDGVFIGLDHLSTHQGEGLIHEIFSMKQCGSVDFPSFSYRPAEANSRVRYVRRAVMVDQEGRTRIIVGVRQLPENGFRPETTSYFLNDDGSVLNSAIRIEGGQTGWSLTPDGGFVWGVILPNAQSDPTLPVEDVFTIAREDRDGNQLWRYERRTWDWAEFLGVAGPRVLFWSSGRFGALDYQTGKLAWSTLTSFIPKEMALSTQLDLGIARTGRQLFAVELIEGLEVFRFPAQERIDYFPRTDPVISSDGRILVMMEQRTTDGTVPLSLTWVELDTSGDVITETILDYVFPPDPRAAQHEDFDDPYPTVADDGVTYVGYGDRFWAIDPGGSIRWSLTSSVNAFTGTVPLLRDDGVLVISRGSREIIGVRTNGGQMDRKAWSSFRNDAGRTNYTP